MLAQRVYGNVDKCPALEYDGTRYWCGIIKDPVIGEGHKEELAIGAGCCCTLNSDRLNIPQPKPEDKVKMTYTLSADAQALVTAMANDWFASPDQMWLIFKRAEDLTGKVGLFSHAWALAKQQRRREADAMMGEMETVKIQGDSHDSSRR